MITQSRQQGHKYAFAEKDNLIELYRVSTSQNILLFVKIQSLMAPGYHPLQDTCHGPVSISDPITQSFEWRRVKAAENQIKAYLSSNHFKIAGVWSCE